MGWETSDGRLGAATTASGAGDARAPAPEWRGRKIDRYVVLDVLGEGGMGIVYSAYDPSLDRRVALKLLRPDVGASPLHASALQREAKALAKLSHPNVVAIHDVGAVGGQLYLAMELVDGRTLREWLAERPRSWGEIRGVFLAAGRGLAAAHAAGLVHRDFKPGNVLIGRDGRVRVLDFGLASPGVVAPEPPSDPGAPVDGDASTRLTLPGTLLGTPAYMAPEQLRGQGADARADQFAYCVALYEALFGTRPFVGETVGETLDAIENARMSARPGTARVPRRVRLTLLRGLAADPAERFPSMDALLAALGRRSSAFTIALGGGLAACTALAAVALVPRNPCASAGADARRIWSPERRAAIGRAFAATGLDVATDAWSRTAPALDKFADDWAAANTQSCRATWVDHRQSQALFDRRRYCFAMHLDILDQTLTMLATPDADLVRNAPRLAATLPSMEACDAAQGELDGVPLPTDPAMRERLDRLTPMRAQLTVLEAARKYRELRDVAQSMLPEARAVGYKPVEVQALTALGLADAELDPPTGEKELLAAALAADASRSDVNRAVAWMRLARYSAESGRPDEAAQRLAMARSAIDRFEVAARDDGLETMFDLAGGECAMLSGDLATAETRYRDAVSITQVTDGELRGDALDGLALTLQQEGHAEEARDEERKALDATRALFGERSATVATELDNLAGMLLDLGDLAGAEEQQRRSLAISEEVWGTQSDDAATGMLNLANTLAQEQRGAEALAMIDRALPILERDGGAQSLYTAQAHTIRANVLHALGRTAESEQEAQRAVKLLSSSQGDDSPWLAEALAALGSVQLERGEAEAAIEALSRGVGIQRRNADGHDMPSMITPLKLLGEADLAASRLEDARDVLQRALAVELRLPDGGVASQRGELRLDLAKAWASEDAAKSAELARRAEPDLRASKDAEALADLQAWRASAASD